MWSETDGWSAPSPGLEGGYVESLAVIGNDLWVGGTFTSAGGQPSNRLAVYAGITTTRTEPGEVPDDIGAPDVAVFPNPVIAGTGATIELSSTVPGRVSVDVYDVLGRHVTSVFDGRISTAGQRLSLNTSGFVPGLYLIQVRANGGQVVGAQSFLVR